MKRREHEEERRTARDGRIAVRVNPVATPAETEKTAAEAFRLRRLRRCPIMSCTQLKGGRFWAK